MKIYIGKNKKEAKQISLKDLLALKLSQDLKDKNVCRKGRFSDDSASWIDLRKTTEKGAIDIVIGFDPETENTFTDIDVYKSKWILDEENMKKLT